MPRPPKKKGKTPSRDQRSFPPCMPRPSAPDDWLAEFCVECLQFADLVLGICLILDGMPVDRMANANRSCPLEAPVPRV